MKQKTIDILSDFVEKDVEITMDSKLIADLGLSSLDVVNVVVAFEDEFDIEIPDRVIPTFNTVSDIASYLERHV